MNQRGAYEARFEIEGGDFSKAGSVSSIVKRILREIGIPAEIIKRAMIVSYEAEVNVVSYAYRGTLSLHVDPNKIQIIVEDEGPGIEDIELAMQEGYSTASEAIREMGFGAGMGLPNIKKNSDWMEIDSEVGKGTKVSARVHIQPVVQSAAAQGLKNQ